MRIGLHPAHVACVGALLMPQREQSQPVGVDTGKWCVSGIA